MKFTYNPRIIKQLGTELITSDNIALSELIKNSYDAKAKKVNIYFLDSIETLDQKNLVSPLPKLIEQQLQKMNCNIILIEDDGKGMNRETLEKGFFEIGSDIKEHDKKNSSEDVILGNKGIGRLSAQRLSPILFVETASLNEDGKPEINIVKVNWEEFEINKDAEAEEWTLKSKNKKSYTRLWMCGTQEVRLVFDKYFQYVEEHPRDLFGNPYGEKMSYYRIEDSLLSTLNFLYSPFEFSNNPLNTKLWYNNELIQAKFNKENLSIAEALHSFKIVNNITSDSLSLYIELDIRPWFIQRIHNSKIGNELYQDYKREPSFYNELQKKYKTKYDASLKDVINIESYIEKRFKNKGRKKISEEERLKIKQCFLDIFPIEGCIYSFKREKKMLQLAYDSAIENRYITKDAHIGDIKSFLEAYNGIKLYRNGFRIATLGDKSSDWLKLQQKRTTGQQFYRFELGNALGYVSINDPKQDYIFETSSREDITDQPHKKVLADLLDYVFNECFYHLTRTAVNITNDILEDEGLIPKNEGKEIEKESDNAKELLKLAEQNLKAFVEAFQVIEQNKDLDSDEKIETVRDWVDSVSGLANNLGGSLKNSFQTLKAVDKILLIAKEEKKRIEIETYNNYKLMANGLVTEVITHELHSLIQDSDRDDYEEKINEVREYLLDNEQISLYEKNVYPVKTRLDQVSNKMNNIQQFYNFLEKTFVYSGKADDFEYQNLRIFLISFFERNLFRLKKYKIRINYEDTDVFFNIPRGAFMHVFYNLVDNSIYWIGERQAKAMYDKTFRRELNPETNKEQEDTIIIRAINEYTIQYFDSGTGVLDKYQYTLFHPMISGKENGRGMGMYIIRKFLESFDAKIELLDDRNSFGNRYIFEITFNTEFDEK